MVGQNDIRVVWRNAMTKWWWNNDITMMSRVSHENKNVHRNHNITPLLWSEVPTEESKVSMWFPSNIWKNDVVIVEDGVVIDFSNKIIKELLLFPLFDFSLQGGNRDWFNKVTLLWFFDHPGLIGVWLVWRTRGWWFLLFYAWGAMKRWMRGGRGWGWQVCGFVVVGATEFPVSRLPLSYSKLVWSGTWSDRGRRGEKMG